MLKFFLVILSVSCCIGQYVSNDDRENDDRNKPCLEISLECPKVDGEYPVYSALPNCSQFCQCSNGRPYLHDCPSVLHFNPVLNVCDYPEDAGCISSGGGPPTEPTETNPCIEQGIDCPEICGESPIYVNLTDCSQYCECYNGKLLFRECPAGLHFNVNLEVCDFPDRAGCDGENDGSGGGSDENNGDGGDDDDCENNDTTNKEVDATTTRKPETTPGKDRNPCLKSGIECPEIDGEFPVYGPLKNCSQFCQCSNGHPYLHDCPADLHFNPVLNVCDYPDRAGCKDNDGGSGENNDSGENGDNGGGNNESNEDNATTNREIEVTTTRRPETTPGKDRNPCLRSGIQCPEIDGEYPVYGPLKNCSQFCQCSNGYPYLQDCPSGLHFNTVLNVCDWPENAGCKDNGGGSGENGGSDENGDNGEGDDDNNEDNATTNREVVTTTRRPETTPGKDRNPCLRSGIQCPEIDGEYPVYGPLKNCSQFCQCSNGYPYLQNCPADLHFNPVLNVCDYPDRAGCKDNDGGSGENNDSGENGDNGGGDNESNEDNATTNREVEVTTTRRPETTPGKDRNPCLRSEIQCPEIDGEYPVYGPLKNCSQFCQCSNGYPYLHDCPADLHFNPVLNVCDYPDKAGCKDNGGGSGENGGSDENGDNGGGDNESNEDKTTTNREIEVTPTRRPETTPGKDRNPCLRSGIQCPEIDGEYPVYGPLKNCSQFCQCSNGYPYLHDCPADLHFNPVLKVCDYPDRAGCKDNDGGSGENNDSGENGDNGGGDNESNEDNATTNREVVTTTRRPEPTPGKDRNPCLRSGIQCPEIDGEYPVYGPLKNCSQFCQCSNGYPYLHDCPADLHFNPVLNVCDYPDKAGCKDNGGGSGENGGSDENGDNGEGDNGSNEDKTTTNREIEVTTTRRPETTPEKDRNPCLRSGIQCPEIDGEYPVYGPLKNCSQFCQCSNGYPYLHDCPADLHFNPVLNVCDYPDRAGCKDNDGGSGENNDSGENGDNGGGDNESNEDNATTNREIEVTTTRRPETTPGKDRNPCLRSGIQCPEIDGDYPVYGPLKNCSQFCQCSNGYPYLQDCPSGLHFNPVLNVCDWPENAGCKDNGGGSGENGESDENGDNGEGDNGSNEDNATTNREIEVTTTRRPETTPGKDRNPCLRSGIQCPEIDGEYPVYGPLKNCSQFCQCSNGYPYLHDCPADLHFNPVLNVCDYPDRAGCKDNGGGSGENGESDENGDNGEGDNDSNEDNATTNREVEVTTTRRPETTPGKDRNPCLRSEIQCPEIDGEYPVYGPLKNCSQFCQCSNGYPYLHDCPADLHFNPVLNVCDYPDRAGCKDNGGGSGENGGSDENGDNGEGDNGSNEDKTTTNREIEVTTTRRPETTPEKDRNPCLRSGIQCPEIDGEYPVYGPLKNCSQFCQCSNGYPYLHDCPADLHFNPVLNVCDYPDRAGCKDNDGGSGENNDSGENGDNGGGDNESNEDNATTNREIEVTTTRRPETTPGKDRNPCLRSGIQCPEIDGDYPVYGPLKNCSQFCQCSNGYPYLQDCPSGLHFNPVLNVCDWPENAGCKDNGGGSGENGESDENGDNGEGDNGSNEDNATTNREIEVTTTRRPETTPGKDRNPCLRSGIQCPEIDGEYPVYGPLKNCSQFCQCSNGYPYLHDCPADLHFNPVLNVCDYPDRAGCKDNGGGSGENGESDENGDNGEGDNDSNEDNATTNREVEVTTTRRPETTPGKDRNPCLRSEIQCPEIDGEYPVYGPLKNCSQFCQCSNGYPYLHDCPAGLHFNPVLNVCDYPDRAGCKDNGGGSGENGGSDENGDNGGGDNESNEDKSTTNREIEVTTTRRPETTPGKDRNPCLRSGIQCPEIDGEYPVYGPLKNCSQFCQCSNGYPYLHDCPADLHFNPVLNVCDYPDRAGCKDNGGGSGENGGSDENGDNGGGDNESNEDKTTTNREIEVTTTRRPETTPGKDRNPCLRSGIQCPEIDGEYPVYGSLKNCSQFCQCSNGYPYLQDCPSGLHFNPVLNVCDWPVNAGCKSNGGPGGSDEDNDNNGDNNSDENDDNDNGGGEDDGNNNNSNENGDNGNEDKNVCLESGIECPKIDGEYPVYAPLPNCSQFCQCSNGRPYLHNCSADLHFNPVLNVCDWPENAGCKGNGGPGGSDEADDGNGDKDKSDENDDNNNGENDNGDGDNNNSNENGDNSNDDNNLCLKSGIDCPKIDGEYPVYAPLPNCSQFCQCSNGRPYLHNCSADLHFNPVLNVCDWPENAGCKGNGGPGDSNEAEDGNGDKDDNNGDDNNDNTSSESGIGSGPCSESGIECPKVDGKYPVYAPLPNCSQFCQCSNGDAYLFDCPGDLHFNPTLNVCDYDYRAGCANAGNDNGNDGEKNICSQSKIDCPEVDGHHPVYAALPDCTRFCQCSNGKPYVQNCPDGLHFNPTLEVCDYADYAGCVKHDI